jgi:hypothetical protein
MMKYGEYLNETLADEVKSENTRSGAARQAKKMGLVYAGFGRYLDAKGRVAYVVQDGKLVPYKGLEDVQKMYDKAQTTTGNPEKTKLLKTQADTQSKVYKTREKEDAKILKTKNKDIIKANKELNKAYTPELFDETQLGAIQSYTSDYFESVNRYLYKGHDEGVDAKRDSDIVAVIEAIDSAFENTQAPFDYSVYTALSGRYNADKIIPGEQYLFRGYLSTSLDPMVTSNGLSASENVGQVLLQIEVGQGQKALHIDQLSSAPGDMETLLPRGTMVQIISGPHTLDPTILGQSMDEKKMSGIALFHCAIVEQ